METLKNVRRGERVKELTREVISIQDAAYLTVELQSRDRSILVVMNHSDKIVNQILSEMDPDDSGYVFFASELEVDPLNNCIVPKHRIATRDEIDGLRRRSVPLDKLPILRMLDPIRRWYNFPKGSTIAIERKYKCGKVEKEHTYFRRVA